MYICQHADFTYGNLANIAPIQPSHESQSICLDFDGVYADTYRTRHKLLRAAGLKVSLEDAHYEGVVRNRAMPTHVYNNISKQAHLTDVQSLPIIRHSLEMHHQLLTLGIPLYIVTSRTDDMMDHLMQFLELHQLRVHGVVNVNLGSKSMVLSQLRCMTYIDDSMWKLVDIAHSIDPVPVLIHVQHTYDLDTPPHGIRIVQVPKIEDIFSVVMRTLATAKVV